MAKISNEKWQIQRLVRVSMCCKTIKSGNSDGCKTGNFNFQIKVPFIFKPFHNAKTVFAKTENNPKQVFEKT